MSKKDWREIAKEFGSIEFGPDNKTMMCDDGCLKRMAEEISSLRSQLGMFRGIATEQAFRLSAAYLALTDIAEAPSYDPGELSSETLLLLDQVLEISGAKEE